MPKAAKPVGAAATRRTPAELTAAIETLAEKLRKVRDIECLIGEPAVIKRKELEADIADAQEELSTTLADEVEERRKAMLGIFSDISIAVSYPPDREGMLLSAGFTITYERLAFDMKANRSVPTIHTCNGFDALPDPVWDYLLEVRGEAIPAAIMELAPGEPRKAFVEYFKAKWRGYLILPSENALASA